MNIEARHGTLLRRWAAALALACLSLTATAGTLTKASKGFTATPSANTVRFGDATPTPAWATTPGAAPYTSGGIGFASDGTLVWGQAASKMPLPSGRSADVLTKAIIQKAGGAGVIARFVFGPAAGVYAVGSVLYELYQAYGLEADPLTGLPVVPGSSIVWRPQGMSGYEGTTALASCTALRAVEPTRGGAPRLYSCSADQSVAGATCGCQPWYPEWQTDFGLEAYAPPGGVTAAQPLTQQQLADKIASESGWPSGATRALAAAVEAGETVTHETPTVSGPATVQGPTTTSTTTTPQGTATTNTTHNWNITYQGDTATITTTTTSVTTNPDGSTTTETENGEEPAPEEDEEKPEYDTPSEEIPKRTETLSYAQDNLGFGGGSCPAPFQWTDALGSHQINLATLCDKITGVVRPLVLMFATVLAIFIVVPGIKQE